MILIQLIQFGIGTDFVYTQVNVKTFLFQTIQFSQTILIETIQSSINMQLVLFNP